MTADYVAQTLASIEVSGGESPAALRQRAEALMSDLAQAVMVPVRLATEAALLRARADAAGRRRPGRAVRG